MFSKNCVWVAACVLALSACQPTSPAPPAEDAKRLMHNDFENNIGWGGTAEGSLTTAKSHSGQWAVQVSSEMPFGFTFERPLGRLTATVPHKMRLQGWALRANMGSNAKLVVQVNTSATDTAKVFYGALPLADAVREFDKWTAISYSFGLPARAAAGNVIKIYLWQDQATAPAYLDDVELFTED
jgi:hypothetical protein